MSLSSIRLSLDSDLAVTKPSNLCLSGASVCLSYVPSSLQMWLWDAQQALSRYLLLGIK